MVSEIFSCFSHDASGAGPVWTPGARWGVGRIYIEDHYALLHTKYESSGPCGFGEEDFLRFSHNAPGAGPVWTLGAQLAGFIKMTTKHCYTQNNKALGFVVSEKKIFFLFFFFPLYV